MRGGRIVFRTGCARFRTGGRTFGRRRGWTARRTAVVALIPVIARTALRTALVATIAAVARVTALVPVPAGNRLRTLTLNVLWRTAEAAQLLAQCIDLPFVGSLLALGQFEQLQHFIKLIDRFTERRDDLHHFIDGLANRFGMRGLGRTR